MKVEFRLHGHLVRYTGRGTLTCEVPEGATLEDALARLGLPERYGFAIFVNLEPRSRMTRLEPGDSVDLVPAEQGG